MRSETWFATTTAQLCWRARFLSKLPVRTRSAERAARLLARALPASVLVERASDSARQLAAMLSMMTRPMEWLDTATGSW